MKGNSVSFAVLATLCMITTIVPPAAAEGVAYCDFVATKCAGAAAAVHVACVDGTINLGIFGKREFKVCTGAAGAASGATSIGAGMEIDALTYAGNVQVGPNQWTCINRENWDRKVETAFLWFAQFCDSSATGACVYAKAEAAATNVLGSLPVATASAGGDCEELLSLVDGVVDRVQTSQVRIDCGYFAVEYPYNGSVEAACSDLDVFGPGGSIDDALRGEITRELYEGALDSFVAIEGVDDASMRDFLARRVASNFDTEPLTYTLTPVVE